MAAAVAAAVAEGAAVAAAVDRVGLGWRPQLGSGILAHLDQIDLVEVIADDYFNASASKLDSLRILASQTPITLHGISLGMASTVPVEKKRLAKMARLVEQLRPEAWSEHLAFVRAGDIEIGHLASPPRNAQSLDATITNLETASRIVGERPHMENVATLIDPPGSTMGESDWLAQVVEESNCPLLLDLHNIYTNGVNIGYDPFEMLASLPLHQVGAIHIAGGRWMEDRILDDHLHDVPEPVYQLLQFVAGRAPQALTVILERDGEYPSMASLLEQLDRARAAMEIGRTEAAEEVEKSVRCTIEAGGEIFSTPGFEAVLARLYSDSGFRQRFIESPAALLAESGLSGNQCNALASMDRKALLLAAKSFAHKRESKGKGIHKPFFQRLFGSR